MKDLIPAERLIVAADFKPNGPQQGLEWLSDQIDYLLNDLQGTGVYIKVGSALRALDYRLIQRIHHKGLKCFVDFKLFDIDNTLEIDGLWLAKYHPEIVTVACATGSESMRALKNKLPNTEILGVTVLTTFDDEDCDQVYSLSVDRAVKRLAYLASHSDIDGFVCSPAGANILRKEFVNRFTINTPGIRFANSPVAHDTQNLNRVMTPAKAIKAGADRIIMGRPILEAKDRRAAVEQAIAEIKSTLSS